MKAAYVGTLFAGIYTLSGVCIILTVAVITRYGGMFSSQDALCIIVLNNTRIVAQGELRVGELANAYNVSWDLTKDVGEMYLQDRDQKIRLGATPRGWIMRSRKWGERFFANSVASSHLLFNSSVGFFTRCLQ